MTNAYDDRLITLGLQIGGETVTYDQGFEIFASGIKYANALMGECEARIDNIKKETRDRLLTVSSPFRIASGQSRIPAVMTLDVGRASYGTFRLFEGNVLASTPSQPPDIGLTLRSLTLSYMLGNIVAVTQPGTTNLRSIAQSVADSCGVTLDFEATDKSISNYSYTGAALKQVQNLNEAGNVNAFIDNKTLVVLDKGQPRGGNTILISKDTGMVGVPEITEQGVRVRCLIKNQIRTGDHIQIVSDINPAANGVYPIYKLRYEVASRETPFYWIIEATKYLL